MLTEAEVLVRKLSQLTPLSQAKRADPRYFIMLCGISCEKAGCVNRPIVDSQVHDSRLRPNQTLFSYTLAKLNFFKTPASVVCFLFLYNLLIFLGTALVAVRKALIWLVKEKLLFPKKSYQLPLLVLTRYPML
jgi:hypothetical protein